MNFRINFFLGTILAKRLASIVAMTIVGALLGPLLTKLQGEFLPAYLIAILATVEKTSGMLQPLVKNIQFKCIFILLIVFSLIKLFAILIYLLIGYNETILLVVVSVTTLANATMGKSYARAIDSGISTIYNAHYSEFMVSRDFLESTVMLVTGGILTLALIIFDIRVGLFLGIAMLAVSLIVDLTLFKSTWWLQARANIKRKRGKLK